MIWLKRRTVLHECDLHASRIRIDLLILLSNMLFNRYIYITVMFYLQTGAKVRAPRCQHQPFRQSVWAPK